VEDSSGIFFILAFLIFLSALLSGSESALLSLPESKIRAMKEQKVRWVYFLEHLKKNQKRVIISILLGSNTVNILIPTLGTLWVTANYGDTPLIDMAMGISTFVLTFLILFFGEILPKSFAVTYNEKFSLYVSPFLYFFTKALFPLVWFFEKISDRLTPDDQNEGISEAEVLAMVSMSEEHGEITAKEKVRIKNLLEFSDTLVSEVMTPRTKINALESEQTLKEAKEVFRQNSHSRMPVYEDNIDSIKKIITLRDIWEASEEYGDEKRIKNIDLRTPYFVPITKKIADLFEDFQRQRTHVAIVLDEHGGTAGLITMEDIFEEIFGEIRDETDIEEDETQSVQTGVWKVSPRMTVDEVEEETSLFISDDEEDAEKNLSFLVLEKLGRFPRKGETISFKNADLIVEKMEDHSVELFRMVKK
jgi:CBS domain containing-hemolysin-like protein